MRTIVNIALLAALYSPCLASNLVLTAEQCTAADSLSQAERARVHCGMLSVPENRQDASSRSINLAVVVVDPVEPPQDDPVLLLHGGPGGGVTQQYRNWLNGAFGRRRVVAFDQRGVERSTPALCPDLGNEYFSISTQGFPARDEAATVAAAYRRCHDSLKADGHDLTQYNTDTTVADIEHLREAIGLQRWHVYGVSYGTTVGLAYLRDHPDRIKSLTLNSVLPLDAPEAANSAVNLMRALHEISAACDAQADCQARFGHLEDTFLKTISSLAREPLMIPNARIGDHAVTLTASAYISAIHQLLYDSEAVPIVPAVMDRVARRDAEPLGLMVDGIRETVLGITRGEEAAVECYERAPFDRRDTFLARSAAWPALRDNMTILVGMLDICAGWSDRAGQPMVMPTSRNGVPMLVLAGAWDPITPPADSRATAGRLGAFYVEIPYMGHGERGADCGRPIVNAFFDDPSRMPTIDCVLKRQPPEFITRILRAPRLARVAVRVLGDPFSAMSMAIGVLFAILASALLWPLVGLIRAVSHGLPGRATLLDSAAVPLSLAAIAILVWAVWTGSLMQSSNPLLMAIGLPVQALPLFLLPWAAAALAVWAAVPLLRGIRNRNRPWYISTHLTAVWVAVLAFLVLCSELGMVVPSLV
jgi:pimeloyl-ACP methyl ester carboxylesterase